MVSSGGRWVRSTAISGDASSRAYERLWDVGGRSAILARYPLTCRVELVRDLEVLRWCRGRGFHVPLVFEEDLKSCTAVLEDLGETDAEGDLKAASPERRAALCDRLIPPLAALADIANGR